MAEQPIEQNAQPNNDPSAEAETPKKHADPTMAKAAELLKEVEPRLLKYSKEEHDPN